MTFLRGPALALDCVASLAACSGSSGSDGPTGTGTPTPRAAVDESKACAYLTAADRRTLAGVALDEVVAADARSGGSQCRWSSDRGLIELTSVTSTAWARTLPAVVRQLGESSEAGTAQDRKDLARARKLLAGAGTFDATEACEAFGTLAEIDGSAKDSSVAVKYLPISTSEVGVSAQVCSDGVLTSIVYSEPGLVESPKYAKAVTVALRAAQARATA
ncbi:MAG: hypothetical protein JWQ91_97 [Aeromicrobium sp.]|uniref:hypothetical protein n=1 Tax=Aeromicrobium sp. TaxID=1871063 RepID=UPI00261415CA|nr:hypothetical protein [Aeromicrobium sp.]MCW2823180.1 hypothetical protein [Aeromicrobium sp.]